MTVIFLGAGVVLLACRAAWNRRRGDRDAMRYDLIGLLATALWLTSALLRYGPHHVVDDLLTLAGVAVAVLGLSIMRRKQSGKTL